MTRGAGPTFWSVFIQLDLRNIFENILVKKNIEIFKFFDDDFFLRNFLEFQNFRNLKIFKISSSKKIFARTQRAGILSARVSECRTGTFRTGFNPCGGRGSLVFSDFGLGQRYFQVTDRVSALHHSISHSRSE